MTTVIPSTALYQKEIFKIAQNKHTLDAYLINFIEDLEKGGSNMSVATAPSGRDYTYIVNYLPLANVPDSNEHSKFILKFKKLTCAYNDKFCSHVLKTLGIVTPIIRLIKHEKRNGADIIAKFQSQRKELCDCKTEQNYLIFMPAFEAETMAAFIENEKAHTTSIKDLGLLFRKIGELSIYDLCIGNDDRCFAFRDFRESTRGIFKRTSHFNAGNIMLPSQFEIGMQVLAIDNGSTQDSEGTDTTWYADFKEGFRKVVKEGRHEILVKHMMLGINLAFCFPEYFSETEAQQKVLEGIIFGCSQLKKLNCQQFIDSLRPHAKGARALTTLQLIQDNLSLLT